MEKELLKISVRNLVEFILRSGDLDQKKRTGADRKAMEKGSRIHRKIQKSMGGSYRAEVSLKHTTEYEEFDILVEGRADGIFQDGEGTVIDEIKGVYRDIHKLEEPVEVHLAQAKCYAYFYCCDKELTDVGVQMTYCSLETEEINRFHLHYTAAELEEWYEWIMKQYYQWALWQYNWKITRNLSMVGMEFPFPYREGQRDVVTGVYRTILRKKQLFIQAPTGVGKTMSTVFPAVRAVGEGIGEKIFYLTARTVTGTVAKEAFGILKDKGLKSKILLITAKEKMCILEEPECTPSACPRAKGHFDRVNEAVFAMLNEEDLYDRKTVMEYSRKYQVCPYEMCLDLASWADGIICDYNYVFDPDVQLKRFFADGGKGDYIFLIDEAHNLVERGRSMYSAVLYKDDFQEIKKITEFKNGKIGKILERCNEQMLHMKRKCDTYQVTDTLGTFPISLMNLMGQMEDYMENMEDGNDAVKILQFYFEIRHFLNMYDLLDENYIICQQHDEKGRFSVKLMCVNPGKNLQSCLDKGRSSIFFSATLLPIGYYKKLLSGRKDDYAIYAKTPFQPEQRAVIIGRDVSSLYTRRGYEEYSHICEYIYAVIREKQGNYMVFFSSYRMLEDVKKVFDEMYSGQYKKEKIQIICQESGMTEKQKEEFLEKFECLQCHTLVGFCVMGGIFAEGIDLTGEKLIGAIIVGTGIPQIGYEREMLKNYYDERENNGFDYAYRLPGINKVFQAAGRVIRTRQDRGIILLLDERFCLPACRELFPREWNDVKICTRDSVSEVIKHFWDQKEYQQIPGQLL